VRCLCKQEQKFESNIVKGQKTVQNVKLTAQCGIQFYIMSDVGCLSCIRHYTRFDLIFVVEIHVIVIGAQPGFC